MAGIDVSSQCPPRRLTWLIVPHPRYPHEGERPPQDKNFYEQIYYHKLGASVAEDTYVAGKDFPRLAEISLATSRDSRYLLTSVGNGDGGQYEHFLRDPGGKWTQLARFSDQIVAAAFGDDALYMLSREHAPHGKVLPFRWLIRS